jgi:ABC-type multidrug transport system permease subunit
MNGDVGMLQRQVRHEFVTLVRTPITLILSVGFPLLFFILLAALIGNVVIDPTTNVRIVQFLAPGLASFGVVMATFSFLAVGLAEARATGVVKRQSGTPVPAWVLVGGRIGAATILAFVAVGLVLVVGWLFYDLQIPGRSIVAIIVTLLVAAISFSACGLALALLLPNPQNTLAVTNGIVIPLAFISDMFMFGNVAMPGWLTTIGWVFPLKHLVAIFADGLNPYLTGSGFQLGHLAVVAAWGALGAAGGIWLLRRGRRTSAARGGEETARVSAGDSVPSRTSAPSLLALIGAQFRHTQAILWRDPSSVFFAVAFPVILVAVIPVVNGGGDREMPTGQPLGLFFGATMSIYGAAVTAYVNMPQGMAEDRERGVLKRIRATPLPAWALVIGRILGALVVALLTLVAIAVLVAVMYRPPLPPAWPAALVTFVVASLCFGVLGVAVASLVRSAQAGIGIALGTLLPLSFISDIFVVGVTFPPVLDAVAWFFPLRHAARAMTEATMPAVAGSGLSWSHLGVLLAWTVAGALVIALRFRWESREPVRLRRRAKVTTPTAPAPAS